MSGGQFRFFFFCQYIQREVKRLGERLHNAHGAVAFAIFNLGEIGLADTGGSGKRFHSQTAMFALTWTAISPITEGSPLHGQTIESLDRVDAELVISLIGLDETLSQTVHARHYYKTEHIRFGERFVDIFQTLPDGRRSFDYRRFHDTEPVAPRGAGKNTSA